MFTDTFPWIMAGILLLHAANRASKPALRATGIVSGFGLMGAAIVWDLIQIATA